MARQPDFPFADWELHPASPAMNLLQPDTISEEVARTRPDAVIHLAAQSFVPESFRDPIKTFDVNFYGTYHLLAALRHTGFSGRVLYVSSGDIYGMVPEQDMPIRENRLPAPRSPYSVSKVAAETLCGQWVRSEDMDIVVARPFNHIGPGQDQRFAVSDFAAQIVEISQGKRPPMLSVGDIDVTRDFLDVRDVIRAYFSLLEQGRTGQTYNVCSGKERTLRDLIEIMARLKKISLDINIDPKRLRANEQRRVVGDPTLLRDHTGWLPQQPIEDTLASILRYWENNET